MKSQQTRSLGALALAVLEAQLAPARSIHAHLTMPGPTLYWNQRAMAMAKLRRRTLLFRPVVPGATVPKHELHSDADALQQQYTAARDRV
jgi:hypothetical protein